MTDDQEFAVRIEFRHDEDGRCHIGSPDLFGLYLAGHDMDALRKDLEPIIKDLVWHNHGRAINNLRFIPSLIEIAEKYKAVQSDTEHSEICVMQLAAA
jgi:hypothetical protein